MTNMFKHSSNRRSAFFYLTGLASNHRRLTIRIDPFKKKDFFTYHNNNYRLFSLYMQLGNDFTIKKKYFNVKHKIIMPVKLVTPALFIQNWANFFSENY